MKNAVNLIIEPRAKDIGISVRRVLPWAKKRMVGPFIFLDHMGPSYFHPPEDHMDVRPHPHIGLSTLTYLFEGALVHRDSLGVVQTIVPGEVNWMTAGKGISHSERESREARMVERTIHGLQFWVALPKDKEDIDPSFEHHAKEAVPKHDTGSAVIDIVAGDALGKSSPLTAHSPMIFLLTKAYAFGKLALPANGFELAVYIVKGTVKIEDKEFGETKMIVFENASDIELEHSSDAVFAILGGETFPEKRYIWWNLVSSSEEKIAAARKSWDEDTFPMVPGDPDKIPSPPDLPGAKKPLGQPM